MKRGVVALATAIILVACGDSTGPTTTEADSQPTTSQASRAVSTLETSLGTVLVNPDGLTMYAFTLDTDGESACYDSCAALWPPVPGEVTIGPGLDSSMFGTTTRTDGTSQLTVNGQPLYLWASDTSPGDVTGQNVQGVWFVVGTDGQMIGAPTGQDDGGDNEGNDEEPEPDPYDY